MNRVPIIGIRKSITLLDTKEDDSGLRKPIIFENEDTWFDLWKFEGVYEINFLGYIRKKTTGEYVKIYPSKLYSAVCLRHPNGDGSTLCCNWIDCYTSTFLHDKALMQYDYVRSIKH